MDYLACRGEVGPHSYGLSEGYEDLALPLVMGIKEWHTKLGVVDGLRILPLSLNLFNSVFLFFCTVFNSVLKFCSSLLYVFVNHPESKYMINKLK